jgi:hypothetical protein
MIPSASSTPDAISQARALCDALTAACTLPLSHSQATCPLYRRLSKAAGKPRIVLQSRPQTMAALSQFW